MLLKHNFLLFSIF